MSYEKYSKLLLLSLLTGTFIACGSSSSTSNDNNDTTLASNEVPTATPTTATTTITSTPKVNQKPIANAGADQNVTFGNQIILDASRSSDDGTIVKYEWSKDNKVLDTTKSIILPALTVEGTYTVTLKVTDDKNETSTDNMKILTYKDTVVLFKTTQGDIELRMRSDIAPKAVENFVTHSTNGYYDGIIFHRIIKNFMIQGGDPLGTGVGGESIWGGKFVDEFDSSVTFDKPFILAMANAGANTNGSQFFITTSTKYSNALNGKYTIFGDVVAGSQNVTKLENVKTNGADRPDENQTIIKASIKFELPN